MTILTLERRLKSLELQVSRLQEELTLVHAQKAKDWRRTIGAFTDDDGLKELMQDALQLREADRKKGRSAAAKIRKPSR